jgi:tetratricopeptide (TPR) repeat protein
MGRYAEAEPLQRRALAVKRKTLGDAHPSVTVSLNNLAVLLMFQLGRPDQAEPLVREALALDRQMFGERHAYVAESLRGVGNALRLQGDFEGAERYYRQALAMNRELFGAQHTRIALVLGSLGITKHLQGDFASATTLFRESIDVYSRLQNPAVGGQQTAAICLAKVLRDDGHAGEAEKLLRSAANGLDEKNPAHRDLLIMADVALGTTLTKLGRPAEAKPLLERGFAMSRERTGIGDWRTGESELALGVCLHALGESVKAEPLLREAADTLRAHRRAQPRLASQAECALAQVRGAPSTSLSALCR